MALKPIDPQSITPAPPKDGRHFIVLPYRVLKDKRMSFGRLRVLLAVCSYARRSGEAWPGIPRLADDTGYSKATVQAHIRTLTQGGYLKTVNNSYTVGKHAKPRMVIYDQNNPPCSEDYLIEDKESLITPGESIRKTEQSPAQPLADETSLFVCWRTLMQQRFNITPPREDKLLRRLATRYTLESFEEAARGYLIAAHAPPPSIGVMLR